MEYTQEQLDEMIKKATEGLFTPEDLEKRVQSEVDRRVETGIQKGLATHKQKWEQEFVEKSKLTAEELAQKQIEETLKSLSEKEKALSKRNNEIEAKHLLTEANVPKSHYDKFIGLLVSDDFETTKSNIDNFINMFNATKSEIETEVKSKLTNVQKPTNGSVGGVTKADFDKMTSIEKIKFKEEHPELFKQFIR